MREDYRRWRLPQLWEMVADESINDASVHLMNLRRQQIALEVQRDRLRLLRDELIVGWPPEKSGAAAVFVQRVDDMIRALDGTARGAGDLRMRVNQVVGIVNEARDEIESLVVQYQNAAKAADLRVGRHTQKLLDERARAIFVAVDEALSPILPSLRLELPTYKPFTVSGVIESPTPSVPGGGEASDVKGRNGSGLASSRFDPPLPAAVDEPDAFGLASGGPVDVGVQGVGQPPMQSLAGSEPGWPRLGGPASPPVIGVTMPGISRQVNPVRIAETGEGLVRGATAAGHPVSSVVPPRIATAGSGSGTVLRGRPAVTPHPGLMGSSAIRPAGSSAEYRDRSYEEYVARRREPVQHWDEGDGWSVQEGVPPVLDAAPDRPHEPGPGVLGLDR